MKINKLNLEREREREREAQKSQDKEKTQNEYDRYKAHCLVKLKVNEFDFSTKQQRSSN